MSLCLFTVFLHTFFRVFLMPLLFTPPCNGVQLPGFQGQYEEQEDTAWMWSDHQPVGTSKRSPLYTLLSISLETFHLKTFSTICMENYLQQVRYDYCLFKVYALSKSPRSLNIKLFLYCFLGNSYSYIIKSSCMFYSWKLREGESWLTIEQHTMQCISHVFRKPCSEEPIRPAQYDRQSSSSAGWLGGDNSP